MTISISRKLAVAGTIGAAALAGIAGPGAPTASAHATCYGGAHNDWHWANFHYDTHAYYSKRYIRDVQTYNGLMREYTVYYKNLNHGQFYSTTCRYSAY